MKLFSSGKKSNQKPKVLAYSLSKKHSFSWKKATLISLIVAVIGGGLVYSSFAGSYHNNFADISSPQCGSLNKIANGSFGIVGLNGTYMDFGTNPCLANEVNKYTSYDLYVGANYPSATCSKRGISSPYNCGRAAAQYNLDLIHFFKLHPGKIWIDAETGKNIPWDSNVNNNNSFLFGLYAGMYTEFKSIGYYSNQSMWNKITGGANLGGTGNWYATGRTNNTDALKYCGTTFGGKSNVYVQFVFANFLDINLHC